MEPTLPFLIVPPLPSLIVPDAMSEAKREAVNNWYVNTLVSRLNDKATGAIVVVMQRVHMNDLSGFLRERSDDWKVLSLPAIAPEDATFALPGGRHYFRRAGEALSLREPVELLRKLERELGSDSFATQYLQQPAPPGGSMVKREWIMRYDTPPEPGTGVTYISWDTASKGGAENSYSVGLVLQRVATDRFYVLEVVRRRMVFPDLQKAAEKLAAQYRGALTLVEDTAIGPAVITALMRTVKVVAIRPEGDKEARLSRVTALMERGELYLPVRAPWLEAFEAELFSFPGSRFNDQVDALSQVLNHSAKDAYWGWVNLYKGS